MRKLVVNQFISLDGIMEAPEKWNSSYMQDKELTADILDNFSAIDGFLLGRNTYDFFAARWPHRSGEMADRFNELPKYVVSETLKEAKWNNSTIISGDFLSEIKKLKAAPGRNILVLGSHKLVQALMKAELIDEYKLYMYALTLGKGVRLFEEDAAPQTLKFIRSRAFPSGATALVYQPNHTQNKITA